MRILIALILMCIVLEHTYALELLKPSLTLQMQRQSKIDKANYFAEKRMNTALKRNERFAQIKAERNEKKIAKISTKLGGNNIMSISSGISVTSSTSSISRVDMDRVRSKWFSWYNEYRNSLGLADYIYDSRLDVTAREWNTVFSKGRGQNHHRRNPGDSYYDFPVIDTWFAARGIDPVVINRSKHTENVGYGYYRCSDTDCTDELIASIRTTWEFFMSEKGKSYDAHYRSIINPYFTKMGFDIIEVPSENRYYITIHYITQ